MNRLFKKYINSVISPDEFRQFGEYINQEKNTASVFGMIEPEWNRYIREKEQSLPSNPALFQRIRQEILVREGIRAKKKLRIYSLGVRFAAVLVVGVLALSIWFYQQTRTIPVSSIQTQTVSIPYGAKTRLTMPDGSVVWLNSGSTLTYSGDFTRYRNVELKGEAFFDVVKSGVPFVVNTGYGKVRVLGTAFNVQAYPDDGFVTTLERGSVRIMDRDNKQMQTLSPGEQIRFVGGKPVKEQVNTELYTSWKDGKLIFQREPFPEMIERMERWFNVRVEYSASDFKDLWFTGTIENETLTEVLGMVCKAAPVSYSYNSQSRTVKIKAKK